MYLLKVIEKNMNRAFIPTNFVQLNRYLLCTKNIIQWRVVCGPELVTVRSLACPTPLTVDTAGRIIIQLKYTSKYTSLGSLPIRYFLVNIVIKDIYDNVKCNPIHVCCTCLNLKPMCNYTVDTLIYIINRFSVGSQSL